MKFIHLSDLHIGKRLYEYSLIEDQEFILKRIIGFIDDEKPDAVLIAGDVYDKDIPPAEAITLFNNFLNALYSKNIEIFIISGNHDSNERLAFGSTLMDKSGVHFSKFYNGIITPYEMLDEFGKVNIYLLPFIKPSSVKRWFDKDISSYTEALDTAISAMNINKNERNILISHQFVTGANTCDSENISVGGLDNVDVSVFADFDYVALGHLHRPQNCSSEKVRYSGTPLKYSFSEANDKKSVTVVEIKEKGNLEIRTIPLIPMRDMVQIKGTYNEVTSGDFYKDTTYQSDYVHITLTDEDYVVDANAKLRTVYKNLMLVDYDNKRTRASAQIDVSEQSVKKSPIERFADFYELQNNQPMNNDQLEFMQDLISDVWEGKE